MPIGYSYGMNVEGVDINTAGRFAWDTAQAPQADPNLDVRAVWNSLA